jgi:hypothetical protein
LAQILALRMAERSDEEHREQKKAPDVPGLAVDYRRRKRREEELSLTGQQYPKAREVQSKSGGRRATMAKRYIAVTALTMAWLQRFVSLAWVEAVRIAITVAQQDAHRGL